MITKNWMLWMIGLVRASVALSGEVTSYSGETITIAINSLTGSLIEFPKPLSVASSSESFVLNRIATESDEKGGAVNVRILNVVPLRVNALEVVPFVLADRSSISIRFIAQAGADRHTKILLPERRSGRIMAGSFIEDESALMGRMLLDASGGGFTKTVIDQKLEISGYDDISLTLARRFTGKGLIGYTFKLVNTSDKRMILNPAALNFDSPNRAILLQIDHETLEPCHINASTSPISNSCITALRLVVRGDHFTTPSSKQDLPFTVERKDR